MKYFFLLILFPLFCFAQKQGNIWYFGDHAGVDFTSGVPIAITNGATYDSLFHSEGTSVISDNSGQLLFYTNGHKIWNRNHQVIPNGDSLFGNFSSTQSSIIVPKPNSSRYFYVFTVDDFFMNNFKYGFRYSIVDLCGDNGMGSVIQGRKNILLLDTVAEKIAVIRHSNDIHYWVIVHKLYEDRFHAFLLTENGLTDTVISKNGPIYAGIQGQLKVSHDGQTLAMGASYSSYSLDLFNFNNSTGIISNYRTLDRPYTSGIYGVEFSPDNSKLYGFFSRTTTIGTGIVQYDLNAGGGILDSINASMNIIYNKPNVGTLRALQMGPDNKIYMVGLLDNDYLYSIDNPNNYGSSSNLRAKSVNLLGKYGNAGLPTFITNFEYTNTTFNCWTGIDEKSHENIITLFPNPFSNQVTLNSNGLLTPIKLELFNAIGEKFYSSLQNDGDVINLSQINISDALIYFKIIDPSSNNVVTDGKLVKK